MVLSHKMAAAVGGGQESRLLRSAREEKLSKGAQVSQVRMGNPSDSVSIMYSKYVWLIL